MTALELRGVSKAYGGIPALRDGNLRVRPGGIHGVVGPNGAGKSTLIKVASGQVRRDAGEILVHGRPLVFQGVHEALKAGIVAMPQELTVVPGLSVAENVTMGYEPSRFGFRTQEGTVRAATEVLRRMKVDLDPRKLVGELEPAAQRVVMLARALHTGAHTVILDEPTAALTAAQAETFMAVVESLHSVGVAVVYISHRFGEIERLSDDVTILRDGRSVDLLFGDRLNQRELVAAVVNEGGLVEASKRQSAVVASAQPALSARKVSGGRLRGVTFDVRPGEILGFCGLPGSGVNDLMEIVGGVNQPEGGTLVVNGRDIRFADPADALREGVTYLPVERARAGMLNLTIRSNLTVSSLSRIGAAGLVTAAAERRFVKPIAAGLDLQRRLEQPLYSLSGGNRQKVLLLRCLLANAKLIVLDDPTVGVDVKARHDIHDLLRRIADEGRAVIVAVSEPEELVSLADRVLVLSRGEVFSELVGGDISAGALVRAVTTGAPPGACPAHPPLST